MASVVSCLSDHLAAEKAQCRELVFVRFFLSDAQNQAPALRQAMRTGNAGTGLPLWDTAQPFARRGGICGGPYSIVEQPPLDGSRIAALGLFCGQMVREAGKNARQSIGERFV